MKPLERYGAVVGHRAFARYLLTGSVAVERFEQLSLQEMWQMHDEAMAGYRRSIGTISPQPRPLSLMGLKRQIALKLFTSCNFCEHDCRVDRRTRPGRCGVLEPHIASQFLHMGEEGALVPSYTVFFSGCNLQCAFCQNYDISTSPEPGREVPAREMATRFDDVLKCGGKNINWVGGDPTPALHYVLDVLLRARTNIAQIWNSNMYMSEKAMSLLDGAIDIYLTDLKYGNDDCAYRLSGVKDYMRLVTRNHLLASSQGEVIVRHLMLPGHLECCTIPVLDWLAGHLPSAPVNIMAQYHPEHRAVEFPELKGRVPINDHRAAIEYARELGLDLI